MTSLLLRSRKDAFEVVTPGEVLEQNLIGDNSGNLIFLEASQRLLTTHDQTVDVDRFVIDPGAADRINERYDAYVIPLANAFRPSYEANLIRLTRLVERLLIPVVVLGVGAQATVREDASRLAPIAPSVRAFVAAVLDHGPSLGVRGEFTAGYLASLGFRDVEVIGCPSLFRDGDALRVTKRAPALDAATARVALNVSPYVAAMGPVVAHHVARYPNLTYVPQDLDALERLLTGSAADDTTAADPIPRHIDHPLYRRGAVRFYVDTATWIDGLRDVVDAYGSRSPGTIAAILAGTPAIVLAHDSRTLEIARWFALPHHVLADLPADTDVADLYAAADYEPFHAALPDRFARFTAYLAAHGLGHAFAPGEDPAAFIAREAATPYPAAITTADRRAPRGVRGRLAQARRRARRAIRSQRLRRLRARLLRRGTGRPA
jgi:hypothetical protein